MLDYNKKVLNYLIKINFLYKYVVCVYSNMLISKYRSNLLFLAFIIIIF